MSDTDLIEKFDWRKALRLIERKLNEYEARDAEAKVLLVDDNSMDVALFKRTLNHFMCSVTVCYDPEQAKEILSRERFDFVFIDQRMPKLNGTEVLQQTFPNGASATRFIVVSGFPDSRLADETMKLGAVLAPKPVSKEMLAMFLRPRPKP